MDSKETLPSSSTASTDHPTPVVAPAPPTPSAPQPQPSAASTPSTPEIAPPSTSSSAAPTPSQTQQTPQSQSQPRAPLTQGRPPGPFPHFSSHLHPAGSSSTPMQRGGMAIGLPAHNPRPHQPGQPFFGPSTSFGQAFGGLPRPDQAQVRQPVPGIQTIGMIGSISSGSQLRGGVAAGQHQPRISQPTPRSASPAPNQTFGAQKLQSPSLSRSPSLAPSTNLAPGPQTPQTLQQQMIAGQGKQMQASPSSYRPQMKQLVPQQRPHLLQQHQHSLQSSSHQQQQQNQKNLPLHLQQIHQQQSSLPNQSQEHHNQTYLPSRSQQMLPPQQAARAQVSAPQKFNFPPSSSQSVAVQSSAIAPAVTVDATESTNHILSKRSIRELVTQIDPSEKLDPEVEDVLVEIAEDFVESITTFACSLAKHRKSSTLEAKDILLHVERNWNMTLPGFSGDEIKSYKKPYTNDIHKERLAMIKKSMVGAGDSGNSKNSGSAQAATNSKSHAVKPNPLSSPKA